MPEKQTNLSAPAMAAAASHLSCATVAQAPDAIVFADRLGAITGALAVARDCGARYRAQRALQARVVELEKAAPAELAARGRAAQDG